MKRTTCILILFLFLLSACGLPAQPISSAKPVATPTSFAVTLTDEDCNQVEVVTPAGVHLHFGGIEKAMLTKVPAAEDVHFTLYKDTVRPDRRIVDPPSEKMLPNGTFTWIAPAFRVDPPLPVGGTNTLDVVDAGGLRIAYFGNAGQDALTRDQLAGIGRVDVAILQFDDDDADISASNGKSFILMDLVQPRLIIPLGCGALATMEAAFGKWTGYYSENQTVTISAENLPASTGILLVGSMAAVYKDIAHLTPWEKSPEILWVV